MGSLHVKFHDDRRKGKAVMRRNPNVDGQTDGQTDGRGGGGGGGGYNDTVHLKYRRNPNDL